MRIETNSFGPIDCADADIIHFPQGLPGFEYEKAFVAIERPQSQPVVFLQSVTSPGLFFVTLPVETIDRGYQLKLSDEYRRILGVTDMARDLLSLAIVCMPDAGVPTANLLGPIVVHRQDRVAVQAVRDDAVYSAAEPLFPGAA
ncbi:MAG: flagellar assembly protein FliW [Acidobacteria bacterium]|nr:flagellar assembly protein FliW [Acidobacteriota bacterium]